MVLIKRCKWIIDCVVVCLVFGKNFENLCKHGYWWCLRWWKSWNYIRSYPVRSKTDGYFAGSLLGKNFILWILKFFRFFIFVRENRFYRDCSLFLSGRYDTYPVILFLLSHSLKTIIKCHFSFAHSHNGKFSIFFLSIRKMRILLFLTIW